MRIYYLSYCLLANRTFIFTIPIEYIESYIHHKCSEICMYTVDVQNGILYEQERFNIKCFYLLVK